VKASYVEHLVLAKKMKHITNGKLMTKCMVLISNLIFPERRRQIDDISISHSTTCCRSENTVESIEHP
jgi:hypothetical protein